jgi:hypothetical protein
MNVLGSPAVRPLERYADVVPPCHRFELALLDNQQTVLPSIDATWLELACEGVPRNRLEQKLTAGLECLAYLDEHAPIIGIALQIPK